MRANALLPRLPLHLQVQMAVVSTEGAAVEKPTVIDSNWEIANFNLGYE